MVRTLASSGTGVDVVVGKAGTGKSTALGAYRAALDAAGIPVVGVAPSATAAHQLAVSANITDSATVDRLLTELRHGRRTMPRGVVVVLDEAAMCPTRTRLALQRAVDAVNGKIVDVGDHRQIPRSTSAAATTSSRSASAPPSSDTIIGSATRSTATPPNCSATTRPLPSRSFVRRAPSPTSTRAPVDAWVATVDDWLTHRDTGHSVLMLATERATVAELNRLARAHLVARGDIARRSRTYRAPDDHRAITLAVGDEVILRRNNRLAQADGITIDVRNGMTGRVTAIRRREITVGLDAAHRSPRGPAGMTLPASYVGEHVEYGYARTVDTAQGATVDHSLFVPSASATAERAYVALSRGRLSNCIYATGDRAWIEAIGQRRGHALAVDQSPGADRILRQVVRLGSQGRDQLRQPPLEIGL